MEMREERIDQRKKNQRVERASADLRGFWLAGVEMVEREKGGERTSWGSSWAEMVVNPTMSEK